MDTAIAIDVRTPGAWIQLSGRLCAATVPDVRLALREAIDAGVDDLVLGLAGVEVVDATGLGVMVGAHRRALRAGRRLVLRDVPPQLERLLSRTRLQRVLHIEPKSDGVAV